MRAEDDAQTTESQRRQGMAWMSVLLCCAGQITGLPRTKIVDEDIPAHLKARYTRASDASREYQEEAEPFLDLHFSKYEPFLTSVD